MKTNRYFWLLSGAPLLLVPFTGGCMFLKAPEPLPTPTPVPAPKAPFFEPTAGMPNPPLTHLNAPGDPKKPDAFRIASATTGDTVAIQSVDTVKAGNPAKDVLTIGAPDTVKLAGIIAPSVDPGLQGARNAISGWTVGQNLDVDQDPKFPTDLTGLRLMQVYFKGRKGPYEGQVLSLNRMLVRSGWAVVDLYSPTSFDTSQWLLDEAYARDHKLGFWKFGQVVQQRVPVKVSTPTARAKRLRNSAASNVTIVPNPGVNARANGMTGAMSGTASQSTTTQTRTQTSKTMVQSGGVGQPNAMTAPGMAGAPPVGAVPAAPPAANAR